MMLRWKEIVPSLDVHAFDCGDEELNEFLRDDAMAYSNESFSKTFVFFDDQGELVGFSTTCTDSIQLSEKEKKCVNKHGFPLREFPSVKIARLAVAKGKQSRGFGKMILSWTIDYIKEYAKFLGARFITVDAVSKSVGFYEKHLFTRNQHKRHKRRMTTSMRLDMHVV